MRRLAFAAALGSILATSVARADPELGDKPAAEAEQPVFRCNTKQADVTVTFKPEIEVRELVTWAVGFTCKKFLYDARVVAAGRKVTIIAPQKLSRDDAYQVFLAALATAGLAVVPKGTALAIVEAQAAKKDSLPLVKHVAGGEELVRYVVKPTYVQPEVVRTAFATLKSDAGDITPIGSMLLVTDYASHVRDMVSLLALVDVPGGTDGIYAIPVIHADATKLAQTIDKLLAAGATAAQAPGDKGAAPTSIGALAPKILVDERTNTLMVAGTEAGYRRAKAIADRLDIALALEDGAALHVYPLSSAIAEELAATLEKAITQQKSAATTPGQAAGPRPGATATATTPSGGNPLDALPVLTGTVHVVGDKSTNALLVTASAHDYLAMRDIIRQLDQPRRQVYIEAMIVAVSADSGIDFGASSHAGVSTSSGAIVLGGVNTGTSTLALGTTDGQAALAATKGLVTGIVGSALTGSTLLGTSIPSYALLFNALATTGSTDILSEPSIIAVDNEEAKYKIGTNVPYIKGQTYNTTTTNSVTSLSPINNVDRQDLTLELDIKPHISEGDNVLLEIKHSSKELGDTSATLGPSWSTRELETRVLVADQHTVAIGGLRETKEVNSITKVPLLGDIPILGHLFKYTTKTKHKADLLILLTPYVIRDQSDLERIRARKAMQHDELARSLHDLDSTPYVREVDYSHKRGLLEEINRAVADVEHDIEARAGAGTPAVVEAGLVESR